MASLLHFLPVIDSTNTYAVKHFDSLTDGTLVAAGAQTAGKGRLGRVWLSPEGVNIYATLVVKTPGMPFLAGAVVGLAGIRLVRQLIPEAGAFFKWPNDIYCGHRKLAGILCDGAGFLNGKLKGVAAGIGININLDREALAQLDQPAVSLAALAGKTFQLPEVLDIFAELTSEVYRLYREDQAELFRLWKKENRLIGHELSFAAPDGSVFRGIFEDVTDTGEMLLLLPDGTRKELHCGDVRIQRDSLPSF
jgi:BirA family biotin operon repressor/biotin-[acetyl-CoA-carboxylase] ligase